MNNYIVRPTIEADWAVLKALRLEALQDSPEAFTATYLELSKHRDSEWQARAAQKTACYYVLAFDRDVAIGMIGRILENENQFMIVAMWVKPEYRAQKLATQLMSFMQYLAMQQGYSKMTLNVNHTNHRAIQFYEKYGFVVVQARATQTINSETLTMCYDIE